MTQTPQNSSVAPNVRDYTDIAPSYNSVRFNSESGAFLYETDRLVIKRLVAKSQAKKVLDVPTGTGRVLDYLGDMDLDITGFDATPGMLDVARKVHCPTARVSLQVGDASKLPFDSGSFDLLVSLRFFHLFNHKDRLPFAKEFDRVVKKDGFILISFTNGWYGGGYYWLRKFLGLNSMYLQSPGEVSKLFPNFKVD
jgi:ubiquinone/menaquinone biosynthesis C-methylase UbiE